MRWLWLGVLLCAVTAGLYIYVFTVEAPAITALVDGMKLPDAVLFGYDVGQARTLFDAFVSDHRAAQLEGRQSASEAYLALHAGLDLVLPPLLAASIGFCAFAALFGRAESNRLPRAIGIAFALTLVSAFTFLGCDFIENSVADAMFAPKALALSFNDQLVFVLQVLTRGKYASLLVASGLIATLWVWRWASKPAPQVD
ncbi:hypothetical protein PZ897_01375 [Hoeflea sp. YIM 152468]|uniref:hypothetical protein n=1 Tax=Hoeflea sp. YIM 152468 TaxID=3031759 RepID=UPI0023D9A676|nr:hypothetical protein [Hoeflea sp. YIM 152468]MDF1606819.1 hypothetical protein [Hoeflea sp. YIM 152468]